MNYYVSLTKLTTDVLAGSGLTRDIVLNDLIHRGYVKNIREATPQGLSKGVRMQTGKTPDSNGKYPTWPTYGPSIQRYYISHAEELCRKNGIAVASGEQTGVSSWLGGNYVQGPQPVRETAEEKLKREAMEWIKTIRPAQAGEPASRHPSYDEQPMKKTGEEQAREYIASLHLPEGVFRAPFKESYTELKMPADFVCVDTEATGFSGKDEIIEFSVVAKDGTELYHSTFTPKKAVAKEASAVNGFTRENLKAMGAPKFKDEWEKIKKAVNGRPVLGHNIKFDKRMTEATLERYGLNPAEGTELFKGMFDSRDIAKIFIDLSSYKLCVLANLVGISRPEQHDSTDDCRMTIEFLGRLDDILGELRNGYSPYRKAIRTEYGDWDYNRDVIH
jgi:DNA polymerase III epsilon subunit-like protein